MPNNKKPRRPYRPGKIVFNPIAIAAENAATMDRAAVDRAILAIRQSLDWFAQGLEPESRWRVMADALNMAEAIAYIGICSDAESFDVIESGQAALAAIKRRQEAGEPWSLTEPERQVIDAGLERHAIQLRYVSRSEYDQAILRVRRRCDQARRGAANGVIVLGAIGEIPPDAPRPSADLHQARLMVPNADLSGRTRSA